jgi:hypothetical protein
MMAERHDALRRTVAGGIVAVASNDSGAFIHGLECPWRAGLSVTKGALG